MLTFRSCGRSYRFEPRRGKLLDCQVAAATSREAVFPPACSMGASSEFLRRPFLAVFRASPYRVGGRAATRDGAARRPQRDAPLCSLSAEVPR